MRERILGNPPADGNTASAGKPGRKAVGKKLRFEVFKRDGFTCQYCGQSAPTVVLQVDHIRPVSDGGSNDLMNLVTSCAACNSGKSDRLLSDASAVQRQRAQLAELHQRREQLDMMLEWRDGLRQIADDEVSAVLNEIARLTGGILSLNERGKATARKLIEKHGLDKVLDALEATCLRYLVWADDGSATKESFETAWRQVGAYLAMNEKPEHIQRIHYVRGILRKRLSYIKEEDVLRMLIEAHDAGVSIEDLESIAKGVRNWTHLNSALYRVTHGEPWR